MRKLQRGGQAVVRTCLTRHVVRVNDTVHAGNVPCCTEDTSLLRNIAAIASPRANSIPLLWHIKQNACMGDLWQGRHAVRADLIRGPQSVLQRCPSSLHDYSALSLATCDTSDVSHEKIEHARILDGRAAAAAWQGELSHGIGAITAALGRPPCLAVLIVGQRPDSLLYVSRKLEACTQVGITATLHRLPGHVSQETLQAKVKALCIDSRVDGVLVQLPLPPHINEDDVIDVMDPSKDVDGFHPANVGRLMQRGRRARFVACTALGAVELLQRHDIKLGGKRAVVIGDSNVVGLPLAMLLREHDVAAVTICHRTALQELYKQDACHSAANERAEVGVCLPRLPGPRPRTTNVSPPHILHSCSSTDMHHGGGQRAEGLKAADTCSSAANTAASQMCHDLHVDLPSITRVADILVVAVGIPHLVKASWVKPGAVLVDVGINIVQGGEMFACCPDGERPSEYRVVGDVDFDECAQVASAITPVPGGIGPMTIAAVLHNVLQSARHRAGM